MCDKYFKCGDVIIPCDKHYCEKEKKKYKITVKKIKKEKIISDIIYIIE